MNYTTASALPLCVALTDLSFGRSIPIRKRQIGLSEAPNQAVNCSIKHCAKLRDISLPTKRAEFVSNEVEPPKVVAPGDGAGGEHGTPENTGTAPGDGPGGNSLGNENLDTEHGGGGDAPIERPESPPAKSDAGSADSSATKESVSTSNEDFPQAATRSAPPDLVVKDTKEDSLGVNFANNAAEDKRNPGKPPLRSIATSLWASKSGKAIGDLKSINYQQVKNAEMEGKFPQASAALQEDFSITTRPGVVTLTPSGTGPNVVGNDAAFDLIMYSAFGGLTKMLGENTGLERR